jgi:dolichol-phosphate mannosyltransferase
MRVVNIIPTYNEKENIGKMLETLERIARKNPKYEFLHLVVDDNSPDGTAKIVKEKMRKNKNIKILEGKRVGLGEALIRGYKYAEDKLKADVIVPNDCDFSFAPEKIIDLLAKIDEGYDVVVASRHVGGGGTEGWSLFRKLNHFVANELFAWYIAGIRQVHDHNGNFKAIRVKGVLDKIPISKLRVKGFGFQCYIIYQLSKVTNKFYEIPVIFKFRTAGETKVSFNKRYLKTYIRDTLEYMWLCINVRLEKSIRFIKFGIVGFIGFIINALVLRLLVEIFNWSPPIASAMGAEVAIISNFTLNNIWTFAEKKITSLTKIPLKFLEFNFTSIGAIIIQYVVVWLGVNFFGKPLYMLYFVIAVALGMIWNYFFYTHFIWKDNKK